MVYDNGACFATDDSYGNGLSSASRNSSSNIVSLGADARTPARLSKGEIIRKAKINNNCPRTSEDYQFAKGTHELSNTSIGRSELCTIHGIGLLASDTHDVNVPPFDEATKHRLKKASETKQHKPFLIYLELIRPR